MASIKELVYTVWKILDGREPTDDSRYSYRQIKGVVKGAIADAMKREYYDQRNSGDTIYGSDNYSTTYKNITVQTDPDTNLKYIDIPSDTTSLPADRDIYISSSNPVSVWSIRYIPITAQGRFVGQLQPTVPCVILYYRENKKAIFYNGNVTDESVNVTRRYSLPDEDDNADIKMPEEYKLLIINQSLQTLNPQLRPVDHNNDGTEQ